MSGEHKTYFLAPTRDSPPGGPIALGSIIASPQDAEMPITPALPINQSVMPIASHEETDWKLILEKHKGGSIGLWGSFLLVMGAGGDVGFTHGIIDVRTYQFDRLETQTFWPTEEYVKASIASKAVQDFLKSKKFFHNVYMVTSIKIAHGANISRSAMRNHGLFAQLGVDGTTAGIPISAGPQGDLGWGTTKTSSFDRESGFVFAFRLREVRYTTKRGLKQSEFVKGALFGLDDSTLDKVRAGEDAGIDLEESQEFELMGLADDDVRADDVDESAKEIMDDGEICECVVLSESA
ncbi:MAG: hypothetical protein LQ337_008547 [Flavoplaca oasis]|nr:MAG: hypothetical protein LQ337_008547 [Flavoplaca oasis]